MPLITFVPTCARGDQGGILHAIYDLKQYRDYWVHTQDDPWIVLQGLASKLYFCTFHRKKVGPTIRTKTLRMLTASLRVL